MRLILNPDGDLESVESGNIILYIGLGLVAIGLVITSVGLGDNGFRTLELKLIGPVLMGGGGLLVVCRILVCMVCTVHPWAGNTRDGVEIRNQEESDKLLEFELNNGNINFPVQMRGEVQKQTNLKHGEKM